MGKAHSVAFDELSHPIIPVPGFWPAFSYKAGYGYGVVHPDGVVRYLQQGLHLAGMGNSSHRYVDHFRILIFSRFQYFLWYLLFLPLLIPHLSLSRSSVLKYLTCWIGTQALWLSQAYKVEFLGEPIFCRLWLCSLLYVIGHSWVLAGITDSYRVLVPST